MSTARSASWSRCRARRRRRSGTRARTRSIPRGKKYIALTVSTVASRRRVDRSKSTIQSSDSGKLCIIWEANTVEHPCSVSPRWGMPQRGLPTNLDPAANAAFRTRDHKPFFGFCRPQLMRQGRQESKGNRRQLRARSFSKRCHSGDRPASVQSGVLCRQGYGAGERRAYEFCPTPLTGLPRCGGPLASTRVV